jgi:F0F1-type ATP synthase assembly protein I
MGLSIGLGFLAGDWLDERFEMHPWFTISFVLLGVTAAFLALYRVGRKMQAEEEIIDAGEHGE